MQHFPIYCKECDELIFSIEVLRHNTSNEPVFSKNYNIKYCPFCGAKIKVGGKYSDRDRSSSL